MSMSIIFAFHTFYSAHSGCYNNAKALICMVYFSISIYTYVEDFHGEHRMNDQVIRDVIIPADKRILAK